MGQAFLTGQRGGLVWASGTIMSPTVNLGSDGLRAKYGYAITNLLFTPKWFLFDTVTASYHRGVVNFDDLFLTGTYCYDCAQTISGDSRYQERPPGTLLDPLPTRWVDGIPYLFGPFQAVIGATTYGRFATGCRQLPNGATITVEFNTGVQWIAMG